MFHMWYCRSAITGDITSGDINCEDRTCWLPWYRRIPVAIETNRSGADLGPVYINDSLPQGLDFLDATDGGQNSGQWVNCYQIMLAQ